MIKLSIMFITIASMAGCVKQQQTVSDEVLLSITNECRATIKFYTFDNGSQYLSDIFDCSYVSMSALQVKPGKYKVKAETFRGKIVEKTFTKGRYAQEINLEF